MLSAALASTKPELSWREPASVAGAASSLQADDRISIKERSGITLSMRVLRGVFLDPSNLHACRDTVKLHGLTFNPPRELACSIQSSGGLDLR
jgi:hypothetical protein